MDHSDMIKKLVDDFRIMPLFMKKFVRIPPSHSFANHSISHSQMEIMFLLYDEGKFTMSNLSKALLISKPNVTPMVDKLINNQFVERLPDEKDRRIIHISLTQKGRNFLDEERSIVEKSIEKKLESLSTEQLEILFHIFENVKKILDMK